MSGHFTSSQESQLRILMVVVGMTSVCACSGALGAFFWLGRPRTTVNMLVVYLMVAEVLKDLAVFTMPQQEYDTIACQAFAFYATVVNLAPIMWTTCISFHMLRGVFERPPLPHALWWYATVSAGLPLVLACVGAWLDVYGDANGYCWVADINLRWVFFYIPAWCAVIFICVAHVVVHRQYKRVFQAYTMATPSAAHHLLLYPLVFVITWIPGTADRLYELVTGEASFIFAMGNHAFGRSQGWFNAVAYGWKTGLVVELWAAWQATEKDCSAAVPLSSGTDMDDDGQEGRI